MLIRDTLRSRDYPNVLRRVRADALPESIRYIDDGCEVASRCLECPLPVCRHDGGGLRKIRNEIRNAEIVRLRRVDGVGTAEIARRFGVHKRTVWRILSDAA
jgi:predicted DNA-binding protein (UPF0251 family)